MMDYSELIKALRYCAESGDFKCGNDCPMHTEYPNCLTKMDTDAAAAIEALEAENKTLHQHIEDLNGAFRIESEARQKAEAGQPHWVSVEEPPKRNDTVLVRDNGYRVLTYLGDGRWEDDYGYGAEFVSDDAEWCYIEPPQEVQE